MKFLPDSAVLGTIGHIKHRVKKRAKSHAVFIKPSISYFPQRSISELLERARHAQEKEKAGK